MRLPAQLVAIAAISFLGQLGISAVTGNPWLRLVVGLLTAVLAVVVYRWVVRLTERRAVVELAGKGAAPALGRGLLVGIGLFTAVIANLELLGFYRVDGLGSIPGAVGLFGFMAAAAVTEELLFRGVLFRIVEEWTGTWIALAFTGLLFGAVHLLNPNASLWGALAIALEAGGLLAAAYAATRTLWVPIGLHFGWNLTAGAIFSTEVSGNGTPQGLLDATTSGPDLITGGAFGPEASPYSVGFCLLATLVFLWLAHRRGRLVPRRRADRVTAATTLRP